MNHLQKETSPYLLQHVNNPVDWYPWSDEALERSLNENKPILISIGYSACHWCHVMEKESFEDEETARLMNENFINIKIDREERPDLDHIYMDAVQAMTGSGGWPLNVFLTPGKKPFFGGTYFPPQSYANRPSWKDVLTGVARAFRERPEELEVQAENLTTHLLKSNAFGLQEIAGEENAFTKERVSEMFSSVMKTADSEDGGFGPAPKFPHTFLIEFLLHHYYYTKNQDALKQATLSLNKMMMGGIYDQLGGGFARYSTDGNWLVPHFEKMLYDNALLISVFSQAYQATHNLSYLKVIHQTLEFVDKELTSEDTGFYSALDADSEGVEGKFYVWTKKEIEEVLGEEADLFCEVYNVSESGNWEHQNILHITRPIEKFAPERNMEWEDLQLSLESSGNKLLERRNKRIRPLLDDKIILGWNALMNTAYSRAFAATGIQEYREKAIANMEFIEARFHDHDNRYHHTFKNGKAKYPAFLDDYAFLIQALLVLQEITGDTGYLRKARLITEHVVDEFSEENKFFYFTPNGQKDIIVRKKEVYDGAVPSGNSVMALNLYSLGTIFDISAWKERSLVMTEMLHQAISKYTGSFGNWATFMQAVTYGIPEIVIIGDNKEDICNDFLRTFIPSRIYQSSTLSNTDFPLLAGKPHSMKPQIFLCKNYSCQSPVTEVDALLRLLLYV